MICHAIEKNQSTVFSTDFSIAKLLSTSFKHTSFKPSHSEVFRMSSNIKIREKLTNHHGTKRNVPIFPGQFLQRALGRFSQNVVTRAKPPQKESYHGQMQKIYSIHDRTCLNRKMRL
jgi:hypothetical protein